MNDQQGPGQRAYEEAQEQRKQKRNGNGGNGSNGSRPVIQLADGRLNEIVAAAEQAILLAAEQRVYQRGGQLVRLKRIKASRQFAASLATPTPC